MADVERAGDRVTVPRPVTDQPANGPLRADVAVVGAGAAGLYAALVAARAGARVALVSRSPLAETASYWARGGIAAALSTDPGIEVLEPTAAVALWREQGRCVGLLARAPGGAALPVLARAVVLATGGMAALWQRTTNPPGAIGAGLSLAAAAGARLVDLE